MRTWLLGLPILLALVIHAGCGSSNTAGMCAEDGIPAALEGDLEASEKAAAAAWAARTDIEHVREAVKHWKVAVGVDPKKAENYVHLARALYFLGDGYLRLEHFAADEAGDDSADAKETEMVATLEESYLIAEKAIRLQNTEYREAACAKVPLEEMISKIQKSDAEAVYWYASALGKYGVEMGLITILSNKEKIYQIMKRLEAITPDFFYAGPYRYLGAYHTKIPFPGGDQELSRKNFEKSIEMAPNYFATRVLLAEMLAVKLDDEAAGKKLFDEQLKYVLDTPANVVPEIEAENLLEKKKAANVKAKFADHWEE